VARLSDGTRKIIKVSEVTGMEGEVVVMQDIFVFEKQGLDPEGRSSASSGQRRPAEVPRHDQHGGDPPPSEIFANRKS